MNSIVIQLAGINLSIVCKNHLLIQELKEFETTKKEDYKIAITEQRLEIERCLLKHRFPFKNFNEEEVERNVLYRDIPNLLIGEGVILIHGVLIEHNRKGYIFTGPSGVGKSTHASFWIELYPTNTQIINGDKVLLKLTNNGVVAYGSPWKGKERIGINKRVKLDSICYLQRGTDNIIKKEDWNAKSLSWLLEQTNLPGSELFVRQRMNWFKKAAHFISLYKIQCNQSKEAAIVASKCLNQI